MYKTLKQVMDIATTYKFTVGAFNMHNLEMLPAMIRGAKQKGAPIIVQVSVGTAQYIGYEVIVEVCKTLAQSESVDVVLHLDHATNFDDIKEAIQAGFSSVMYDGSHLSFRENILRTREVVAYAHPKGVSVEAELGTISGSEEELEIDEKYKAYTDPLKAKEFVEATNIEALAVSVGTSHGSYKAKTEINLELLKELHKQVKVPLVIHGGTGVKDEDVVYCIEHGVRKFNVGTELLVGWTKKAKETFGATKENSSLRNNIVPCNAVVQAIIEHKISLFLNEKQVL